MSNKIKSPINPSKNQLKRLVKARKDLRKMQEEISPFVKRKIIKQYSTNGEWRETSSTYSS